MQRRLEVTQRLARRTIVVWILAGAAVLAPAMRLSAQLPDEDGYELWLRYRQVSDAARLSEYRAAFTHLVGDTTSAVLGSAHDELRRALRGMLGRSLRLVRQVQGDGALIVGTPASSPFIARLGLGGDLADVGREGFVIRRVSIPGGRATVVASEGDAGVLYGVFALLRALQTYTPLRALPVTGRPRIELRLLNHWDNLDRSVERGYAGQSLWDWHTLPDYRAPRYRDYARANASLGINGTVLTNVNANALVLTPEYLAKAAALADVLRPWGIRTFLTARFSAPMELGRLSTADPLDPAVRTWWRDKAAEIYRYIPDFGGFLVKANSEGQPGPQDYRRTHAEGANVLAEALAPHGGVVMWRAFVYSNELPADRVRQAYDEFTPLDGQFLPNVIVQVKNGPLDFQPREPFHPLFGAMPRTPLMMEFQVTKEYLGMATHLAYLAPLFTEVLQADTWRGGRGSTVARVIDGSLHGYRRTGMAGVANIGSNRNWTGSHFNQANWYAFGRLAWDPGLSPSGIADEWIRMTFTHDLAARQTIGNVMGMSREASVNYMTPLGLAHLMARGHHYGPGPWVSGGGRADWTSVYYHRADTVGVGFDRTRSGSGAVDQYAPEVSARWGRRESVPDSLLLWFHRVGWTERMPSGRSLWEEMVHRYHAGVDSVRAMQRAWESLAPHVDAERFRDVQAFLAIQLKEARWWRDASVLYFQTFSRLPIPPGLEAPAHSLDYYIKLQSRYVPGGGT